MPVKYGGRLGRIIAFYPKPKCEKCGSLQIHIKSYLKGDPQYNCRSCRHQFSLPFSDT